MPLRIDIAGLPAEQVRFAASPLAELTAMLHVLAEPGHHPRFAARAGEVWAGMRPELAERVREADSLWRSSQADFLLPGRPRPTLAEELADVDAIDHETYATAALVSTCGSTRIATRSPLADPNSRDRALDLAQARGPRQEAFAESLLTDPEATRARVRDTLEQCAEAFFDSAWTGLEPQLAADLRHKQDLLRHKGIRTALDAVSSAVALSGDGSRIVVDKLQDKATSAQDGVTFIPSVFGSPHLVVVHASGWRPVVQYPVADAAAPVPLETVELRLDALAHPVRLRLVRTLARSPHTTSELAHNWDLSAPEVSRHLAVLRRAGLLTAKRQGRYVRYSLALPQLSALGTDLLAAVLR
ncbi:DUF5937 family protein [Amycolatopsis sp. NPDC004079]|uniref:DUF5937 family protein n=1 Tax=Amycolatopsis sp. NPDC004079 TaxID=3154549 RepID=UPI0033A52556